MTVNENLPTLDEIIAQQAFLSAYVDQTPVLYRENFLDLHTAGISFKCELFQKTGSFKIRSCFTRMLAFTPAEKAAGVFCGTAGNHGVAVAFAAKQLGIPATVIIPETINSFRKKLLLDFNAQLIIRSDMAAVFETMQNFQQESNAILIHPFSHPSIILGTATLAYEWLRLTSDLNALIIPIGGGGLIAGMAYAAKLMNPQIHIYGVEPVGANVLFRSFKAGEPVSMFPKSIADSLCAPRAEPLSYTVAKKYVDDIVLVEEAEIKQAMRQLLMHLKVACEPACAVATAALLGPLKARLSAKKVGVLLCGANIDCDTFTSILQS